MQTDSATPIVVKIIFHPEILSPAFDHANRIAMSTASVSRNGRACVHRVINSGIATICASNASSHASGRRTNGNAAQNTHSSKLTTEKLINLSRSHPVATCN